jgi:hypothetical protein
MESTKFALISVNVSGKRKFDCFRVQAESISRQRTTIVHRKTSPNPISTGFWDDVLWWLCGSSLYWRVNAPFAIEVLRPAYVPPPGQIETAGWFERVCLDAASEVAHTLALIIDEIDNNDDGTALEVRLPHRIQEIRRLTMRIRLLNALQPFLLLNALDATQEIAAKRKYLN